MCKLIWIGNEIGCLIVDSNTHVCLVEDFADFVAYQIYDGLEIQFGNKSLLNGVNNLQFSNALLFLFE